MEIYRKYPRTPHLPWSKGVTSDDDVLQDTLHFLDHEVVVTEKMDGENTTIYWDGHYHARSMDSLPHVSRSYVGKLAGEIAYRLPAGVRVCGENLYAKHSIHYTHLPDWFMAFSVWYMDTCMTWDWTVAFCAEIGLSVVPELYRGVFDMERMHALETHKGFYGDEREGYVVRKACAFGDNDFATSVAKYVRPNHVQTSTHWMHQAVIKNELV